MSLPETPSPQYVVSNTEKHTPPEKQLQGGSWELDTVTGAYHMLSSTVRDGQMLPSPVHPSVYHDVYTVAAEMARYGDYSLLRGLTPPESYLEPNVVPETFTPIIKVKEKLCLECSIIVDRLQVEITLARSPLEHPLYSGYGSQMDMNIKPNIEALSRSARDGCEMCVFILGELENMPTYQLERHIQASKSRDFPIQIVGIPGPDAYYRLLMWFRNPQSKGLYGRTKAFEMCATVPIERAKFAEYASHIGIRLSHHFLSDNTTKFLSIWLDECANEHPICNAHRQQNTRPPTRLIHVGDALHAPRLVELSDDDRVDYLTLSYCWGKSWNSRTTLANLEQHKIGISMEELSPTIRHAVLLTRQLKQQYLWVDALCIVQDSKSDWDAESVRMAGIYRNSILTIAAAKARSSMEGILPDISERRQALTIHSDKRPVPLYIDSVPLGWDKSIEESALSERAWVLQERLLSCRTLFFSSQQMFWECKTKRASQHQYSNLVGDKEIKKVDESMFNEIPKLGSEHRLALPAEQDEEDRDYLRWYNMVRNYSTKALTVSSDKLPAVAGIAQAFEPANDLYIAGTWMDDWLAGLLWRPLAPRSLTQPQNMDHPRAPSWSWVSLDGAVSFPFTSPDRGLSERLRAGVLDTDEAAEADLKVSEDSVLETTQGKEAETNDASGEALKLPSPEEESESSSDDEDATLISIKIDEMTMGGPAQMAAELLEIGHKTSDFLGKETSIPLTLRGHAEWIVGASSSGSLEPPSTLNDWTGTYDRFTGNWEYTLDQEGLEEPFKCLRLIMCSTARSCWALLLRPLPDSCWARIGTGFADSYLVDFSKLAEAPIETVIVH